MACLANGGKSRIAIPSNLISTPLRYANHWPTRLNTRDWTSSRLYEECICRGPFGWDWLEFARLRAYAGQSHLTNLQPAGAPNAPARPVARGPRGGISPHR